MSRRAVSFLALTLSVISGLLIAACGGSDATATPAPVSPTATRVPPAPAPTPTTAPATTAVPTATTAPAAATAAPGATVAPTATAAPTATRPPAPTATPVPAQGFPTPAIAPTATKRGGTIQLPILSGEPYGPDTFESGAPGQASEEVWQPVLNNLIWVDPYGDGVTLVGDAAKGWQITADGRTITFSINQGIKFHDGTPFTAKDVAYNLDRAWKPRAPTTTFFKTDLAILTDVTVVDDYTVRVTLSRPSNSFLQVIAQNPFLLYPAHMPFPDKSADWLKKPIGSGPFKVKSVQALTKVELEKNESYWKPSLPYLDAVVLTNMTPEIVIASFRTGRLDATNFNSNELTPSVVKTLQQAQNFKPLLIGQGPAMLVLNQRAPWNNPKVREALSLILDRQSVLRAWREDVGSSYASPLLMPELGGRWGISTEVMKQRPGFRPDKTQDVARAKQLIKEAGIDPASFAVSILSSVTWPPYGIVVDQAVRDLGFKTTVSELTGAQTTDLVRRGDFDVYTITSSISIDDPGNYLNSWVKSTGGSNWGKWVDPKMDQILDQQDEALDVAKRKQMLLEVQNIILDTFSGAWIPVIQRQAFVGSMPWVQNYQPRLPFGHSSRFRWEQVWLSK